MMAESNKSLNNSLQETNYKVKYFMNKKIFQTEINSMLYDILGDLH